MDLLDLYRDMYRVRAFELAQAELWHQGLISGELHLGTGEEAIAAGVADRVPVAETPDAESEKVGGSRCSTAVDSDQLAGS